jgi:hypothetical protein
MKLRGYSREHEKKKGTTIHSGRKDNVMVHLVINMKPICEHGFTKCQFSTRREAFDALLRIDGDVKIVVGKCPNNEKEGV